MPKDISRKDLAIRIAPLSTQTRMVGREPQLRRIKNIIARPNERRFIYCYASGGLGKTRLLEEVEKYTRDECRNAACSGIIDLYHADVHSRYELQEAIAAGLDPKNEHFQAYRRKLQEYNNVPERRQESPATKSLRQEVESAFRSDLAAMTKRVRLVLCFDTFEHVQFPETIVDATAAKHAPDLWLSTWLIEMLASLDNVVAIFAGRPRENDQNEVIDLMRRKFRGGFEPSELFALTVEQTGDFIRALEEEKAGEKVLPEALWTTVWRVSQGKPVLLHLIYDLLTSLAANPRVVREQLEKWAREDAAPEGQESAGARYETMQGEILRALFEAEVGPYLSRIALLPKGVDEDILVHVLEMSRQSAHDLIERLRPLSFVKTPKGDPSNARNMAADRLFLHDELYEMFASPKFVRNVRKTERETAEKMWKYLDERIQVVKQEMAKEMSPEAQRRLRRQAEQLHLEHLYYKLVDNPGDGYDEYRALANVATRTDNDDFGTELLDEFLRFYKAPRRAGQLDRDNISYERMLRERTLMWMERLHWSEHWSAGAAFAQDVRAKPEQFHIASDEQGSAIVGHLTALQLRDYQLTGQLTEAKLAADGILHDAEKQFKELSDRPVSESYRTTVPLACARLATSIGYAYDDILDDLDKARLYYDRANFFFTQLRDFSDELAFLANNYAFLLANLGEIEEASKRAHRARRKFMELDNLRGQAYALSTLANVEIRGGEYDAAITDASLARSYFNQVGEDRGLVLALMALAQARRKQCKSRLLRKDLDSSIGDVLNKAEQELTVAIELARVDDALRQELRLLYAKRAKVFRERGVFAVNHGNMEEAKGWFAKAAADFENATREVGEGKHDLPPFKKERDLLDARVDYAEYYLRAGNAADAKRLLQRVEARLPRVVQEKDLRAVDCRLRGKIERLYCELAKADNDVLLALKRAIGAHSYFTRFSKTDRKRRGMMNEIQGLLDKLTEEGQVNVQDNLYQWLEDVHPQPYTQVEECVLSLW